MTEAHRRAWTAFFSAQLSLRPTIDRAMVRAGGAGLDEYGALLMLELAPERRLRMGELALAVALSPSGATRLVDRLETKGWVVRSGCPNDRRASFVAVTPAGLAAREAAWEVYRPQVETLFAERMSEEEARVVADVLERLSEGWRAFVPPVASVSDR